MEYVYAALLLEAVGSRITAESISHVLRATDAEVNTSRARETVEALDDIDIGATVEDPTPGGEYTSPYIYGALLLHGAGVQPTETELSKVLRAAGLSPDQDRAEEVAAAIQNVDIKEVVEEPTTASSIADEVASAAAEERQNQPTNGDETTAAVDRTGVTRRAKFEQAIDGLSDLTLVQRHPYYVVHRGALHDREGRSTVQLRSIPGSMDVDDSATQEILDVVRRWRNVATHPNVVEVRRWDERPQPWLLVPDQPVTFAATRPAMDVSSACDVILAVAEALRNGGLYNLSHGNLVPWNVRVGTDGTVTVDDWGFERTIATNMEGRYLTGYTAPEQVSEDVSTTAEQTDVYGLGALAYFALTGIAPFEASEAAILDSELTLPSEVHDDLPPAVDEPIERALSYEPSNRPDGIYASKTAFDNATQNLHQTSVIPEPAGRERSVKVQTQDEPAHTGKRDAAGQTGQQSPEPDDRRPDESMYLTDITGVDAEIAAALNDAGYETVGALRNASQDELQSIDAIGIPLAARIKAEVDELVSASIEGEAGRDEATAEEETTSTPEDDGEVGDDGQDGLVDSEEVDAALATLFESDPGEPRATEGSESGNEGSTASQQIPPAAVLARRAEGNVETDHLSESESNLPLRTYLYPDEQPHYYFNNVTKGLRYTHPDWDEKRTPYNVGFRHRGERFLLVTDKRVLFVGGNVGEQDDRVSFPYEELVDASAEHGFLTASLTIIHQDDRKIAFFDDGIHSQHLGDAAQYIRERIHAARQPDQPSAPDHEQAGPAADGRTGTSQDRAVTAGDADPSKEESGVDPAHASDEPTTERVNNSIQSLSFCPKCGTNLQVFKQRPTYCPECGENLSAYV